jgi:plasmid maintenance system antidote protein VapI
MSKQPSMSDVLRRAIAESGIAYIALGRETKVQRMSIARFMAGRQSLRLHAADRLAAYFGLELRAKRKEFRSKAVFSDHS